MTTPEEKREEARAKAWDSLSRYKFLMFGYWAAIWQHMNELCEVKQKSPFRALVHEAKFVKGDMPSRRLP